MENRNGNAKPADHSNRSNPDPIVQPTELGVAASSNSPKLEEADQLVESGWRHYSQKEYSQAVADFHKALDVIPDHIDTLYAMGMSQQANNDFQEAIATFNKVLQILANPDSGVDKTRAMMLTRLAQGHINRMQTGDWQLDKTAHP